jgi:hypothetical protein
VADVGWVYRYEAYLIALSIFAIACSMPLITVNRKVLFMAACIACAPLAFRSYRALVEVPEDSHAIYSQQLQMSRFVSTYYNSSSIAANDIGAISYFSNIRLLDLVGLANTEVLLNKRNRTYTTRLIASEASLQCVEIAIVYDAWFSPHPTFSSDGPPLPRSWVRAGRWKTPISTGIGGNTVSFYAVRPEAEKPLREAFRIFSRSLPSDVSIENN